MTPELCFFDVDETLITVKSMLSFQSFYYQFLKDKGLEPEEGFIRFEDFKQSFELLSRTLPREEVNRAYYRSFEGRSVELVEAACEAWFEWAQTEYGNDLWQPDGMDLLRDYQQQGSRIFLVSGSFKELLAPLAQQLGVTGVIATELVRNGDNYTGDIIGQPCIGEGKASRIREYCEAREVSLSDCCAVGDHISDSAMLEVVGRGHVIAGNAELEALALERQWLIHGEHRSTMSSAINM
ncbi:HAD family hydrolase [Litoribrevibacter albus]|uniref:HAD-IB family hydrolase n=1 Tax=Litoribrevibacter albus TaxID=1473156 RepID=A0AA37S8Q3_9GAMM|nr:HAD-IB family hydrolase [Litoribrevibacter albus]GLQ30410.1 hypothetical protein GCM10007876_08880 [Litoribrevibacter albus]